MNFIPPDKSISDHTWKILIIEDDEDDYLIVRDMLKEAKGRKIEVHWAATYEAGQKELAGEPYEAVLVDYDLGVHKGIELIRDARDQGYPSPLILFTGRGGYEVDLEAMKAGATLYLTKSEANPLLLERVIRYSIEIKQKEVSLRRSEAHLRESEEKFSLIFEKAAYAAALSRLPDGTLVDVNDAWERLFGFTRQEAIGKTTLDLKINPDQAARASILSQLKERGSVRDLELALYSKTGERRIFAISIDLLTINGQQYMLNTSQDITERKRAEQKILENQAELHLSEAALRANEARLREFLENTHDTYFSLDRQWRFTYANRRFGEVFGVDPQDVIGKNFWEQYPDYLGTDVEQHYRKAMVEGVPVQFQRRGVYSPGLYDISLYPTREGLAAFAIDRTTELLHQQQLEAERARLDETLQTLRITTETLRQRSQAVEQSPACVVITDLSGKIEYVNPKFTQLTGYSMEEALGQNPRILKSGQTPSEEYQQLWETVRSGRQWQGEFCNRKKNGELYWEYALISPITNEDGAVTHFVAVKEDITERKLAEQALREAHNYATWMARFPDENPNPVVRVSAEGIVLYRNLPAGELAGWNCQVGQPIEDPFLALISQAMTQSEEVQANLQLAERFYSISVMPFSEEGYANIYGRDITERKQAEEALAQAASQLERSNQELEQFAFVASHDLQEPLRKIRLFSNSIQQKLKGVLDGETQDHFDRMINATERMQAMIQDLLELSRVNTQGRPFIQVDLNTVATEVVSDLEHRILRTSGQVTIEALPSIEADPIQIHQMLQNLIGNALKFHKPDTPPWVRITSTRAKLLPDQKGGMISIQVQDNGIGFEEEQFEKILQPFQRLHGRSEFEGNGIGLAIVKKIIDRHQGTISAHSVLGEGSIFTITLPMKQAHERDKKGERLL